MPIPDFTSKGQLPPGVHICSGEEFLKAFCGGDIRKSFIKPISDILDYAKERGAQELFIGGSFITDNKDPNDFDCVIVFAEERYIPNNLDQVVIKGLKFDILLASLDNPKTVDAYIKLFSSSRYGGEDIGIIQIDLYLTNKVWEIKHYPRDEDFEIIKRAYNDRSLIDIKEKRGVLVTVHGLLSRAEWNKEIVPVASSQDWIIAPFIYDTNKPDILFRPDKRHAVLEEFRAWIYELQQRFEESISIIAHSYGTFIIGSYLEGFPIGEPPPVSFNSIILTGSILSQDFDWERHRGIGVGSVYNTIAPNDEYVKYMPESQLKKYIGMSNTFGKAGINGFSKQSPMITEGRYEILNHTNSIKRDIIEQKWMPFLNANRNSLQIEMLEYMQRKHKR